MIKVKLVHPAAKLPQRNNPADAGADLFSVENKIVPARGTAIIDTGIQIQKDTADYIMQRLILDSYFRIAPRSGLAAKYGIDVFAGVVDRTYLGSVKVVLANHSDMDFEVKIGDRIAQLIEEICTYDSFVEVDSLEETSRGDKGFGSSGIS